MDNIFLTKTHGFASDLEGYNPLEW